MNEVVVSICCITYNHEKYIRKALDSFIMQKVNFCYEILIHDDASTDRTAQIIKEYEKKYPDIIKPIYQVENQYSKGKTVSNKNFSRAKGKYIALCEGDDYWTDPFKLQKQFDYMEKHNNCGLCFHTVAILNDKNNKIIGYISPGKTSRKFFTEDFILGGGGFLGTNSIFCRTLSLQNIPNFYKNCKVGDYPLQIITVANSYGYFMNESMSIYRVNVENSWSNRNKNRNNIEARIEKNNLYRNLIQMLTEYNNYTNNRYNKSIFQKIKEFEVEILLNDGDLKGLKTKNNYPIYKKLSLLKKIKGYLNCYFPNITYKIITILMRK